MEFKYYCLSEKCCRIGSKLKPKVEKFVPRGTVDCPDCHCALVKSSVNKLRRCRDGGFIKAEVRYEAAMY